MNTSLKNFCESLFKEDGFILVDANSKEYIIGDPGEKSLKLKILNNKKKMLNYRCDAHTMWWLVWILLRNFNSKIIQLIPDKAPITNHTINLNLYDILYR